MATPTRLPRPYRPSIFARVIDGLRYGGGLGQWSWLIHRLTGLGILFFLIVHVLDTFFVVSLPSWYDHTVALYGGIWFNGQYYATLRWLFRFAELGLIASVVFHAVNGLGIILYDFWVRGTRNRKEILLGVQVVFLTIMIPTTIWVLAQLAKPPGHLANDSHAAASLATETAVAAVSPSQAPRSVFLMFGVTGVAFVWLGVVGFAPPAGTRVKPASGFELRAWYLMRISGLLLVILAVGHLFIMHILNNVETINYGFVAGRWDDPRLGPLWRMWDLSMIVLAVGHGFNGLRQILFEYIARPGRRVLVSTLIWCATVGLLGVGSYAIIMFKTDRPYMATKHSAGLAHSADAPRPLPAH